LTERERATPGELEQKALFEQCTKLLCRIAEKHPLLILLDDLQWADKASLNLLFQLGRELPGGHILVVGAYRPEEVALGRGGERHPLEEILAELKRLYGDVWIDLSLTQEEEERRFVEAFLDSEPNQLGNVFREALFDHTGGHPLFTVELLREMQQRGDLVRDEAGYWIEGEKLDWTILPARVDGVIEARIGRLEDELREILTIASVEGEDFTAQVVARVREADERGLVRQLSGDLDKVHRLVGERGALEISGYRLYLYRFQHHLFQKFLYNGLRENEREMLHGDVGEVLEELYGDQSGEVAAQLAWHFSEAGEVDKAVHYLLMAGDRARVVYAYQEAVEFYQRAIVFLQDRGDYELAARTLMKLGMTYHTIFEFQRSQQAYDEAFVLRQRAYPTQFAILEPAPHPFKLIYTEPPTLDPTLVFDENSGFYIESIFSGLVKLGTELEIMPDVALSWEISEDGCRYVFHLRDDVQWSDGTQVTAEDFVYAWKRTLNPITEARQDVAGMRYDIKGARAYHMGEASDPDQVGARAIDELTLEVVLERPAGYFLHLLTTLFPVPRHVVEAHGEAWTDLDNLVTNGPFLLESFHQGESIILVRNSTFHGRFPGNLQQVEVKLNLPILSSGELEMYELDRVDIAKLGEATYPERHRYVEEYISGPEPGTIYVGFDTSRSPYDDPRVRRAFVMSVDRERLADEVLGGYQYPATGGLVPPVLLGHSPGIALPYDPDQARQLLAQAGYPEGRGFPGLELVYYRVPDVLEYLKAQWSHNLNVEIAIEIREWASVLKELLGRNLLMMGWIPDYPDPDSFLRVCVRAHVPYWRNEAYDRLLEGARRTSNQGDRIPLYQAADKILIEEAVIMPIAYFRAHRLVKPWVKLPGGGLDFRNLKAVIIEPH
jgi:oligopeptide transport system substrate-binding protein